MKTFYFIMQHTPSPEQLEAARAKAERIVALDPGKPEAVIKGIEYVGSTRLLNIPDDPCLTQNWFVLRAAEIFAATGAIQPGDVLHAMGQPQLVNSLNAVARRQGIELVESVTARESIDEVQLDGSTKKVAVFRFRGYRPVYEF